MTKSTRGTNIFGAFLVMVGIGYLLMQSGILETVLDSVEEQQKQKHISDEFLRLSAELNGLSETLNDTADKYHFDFEPKRKVAYEYYTLLLDWARKADEFDRFLASNQRDLEKLGVNHHEWRDAIEIGAESYQRTLEMMAWDIQRTEASQAEMEQLAYLTRLLGGLV